MELEVGSTIGDYQITGILGAGGMGKVYKVRNAISDRVEALKVLLPDLAANPELADRFLREIKVLAMLEHPNIAQLRTAVRAGNQLLMVMELVEGETLERKLKSGALPLAQAVDYVAQVLSALDFAHARGVVHRDIKPANMMLTPAGAIKLMDFGIAKAAADQKLTMTGMTMGSVYYMSPEQIQGVASLDARADIYSVGVTLYELVTGKRPFDGESQYSIMAAHLEKIPAPPITLDPRLPQALNDAILMAVAKDPNTRFQSAGAFRNALLGVAASIQAPSAAAAPAVIAAAPAPEVVPAVPAHAPVRQVAPAPSGGKRWLWMTAGGLAAAAAIVCAIQFAPWRPGRAAVPAQQQSTAPVQTAAAQPAPANPETAPPAATPDTAQPAASAAPQTPPAAVPLPAAIPAPRAPKRSDQASLSTAVTPTQQPAVQSAAAQPAAPPAVAQPQPASAAPPAAPAGPSRAEILQTREHLAKLQVRAGAIRESVLNLKQSMQSQGLTLNARYTQPESLMNTYLRSAENALNQSDLAAVKEYADKAEHQIEVLEKLLNL